MIRPSTMAISIALTASTPGYSEAADYVYTLAQTGWSHYQEPISRGHDRQVARDQLVALFDRCTQSDWDGHGASAVHQRTYYHAYKLLESLPAGIPIPEFGAEPDGQITFDWHRSARRTLSVSVSPDGDLHFAALIGTNRNYGTEAFWDELPQPILELIGRVYGG
jgi:hypothetical protein